MRYTQEEQQGPYYTRCNRLSKQHYYTRCNRLSDRKHKENAERGPNIHVLATYRVGSSWKEINRRKNLFGREQVREYYGRMHVH